MELITVADDVVAAVAAGLAVMGITLSGSFLLIWALTGRMD